MPARRQIKEFIRRASQPRRTPSMRIPQNRLQAYTCLSSMGHRPMIARPHADSNTNAFAASFLLYTPRIPPPPHSFNAHPPNRLQAYTCLSSMGQRPMIARPQADSNTNAFAASFLLYTPRIPTPPHSFNAHPPNRLQAYTCLSSMGHRPMIARPQAD